MASDASPPGSAYDEFAYPGFVNAATHPARIEAVGRLFGLDAGAASTCRMLELGCGDGGNLLSIAQSLPNASFVGLDAAAGPVSRGSALARAAGLRNVELLAADIEQLPGDLGSFDYVVAHGLYSWIPPRTRVALLATCRRHLTPNGIAFISYNAYPGSYLRDMARDMLHYHVRSAQDAQERLALAQQLMTTIVGIDEPDPFAQVLRQYMERMLQAPSALLVHDDLAEISTPFYFHEFMEHAEKHDLRFLSEAELHESQMRGVPLSAGELIGALPDDRLVREQYLDFFKNRMFRQTLLCHADAAVRDVLDDTSIERLLMSSLAHVDEDGTDGPNAEPNEETFTTPHGFSMTTSEPLVRAAMHALADAAPAALAFEPLLELALEAAGPEAPVDVVTARLRNVLVQAHLAQIVRLQSCPPPLSTHPGERPVASPLARAQCAAGSQVLSSLLHENVRLEGELEPRLLQLLDGTRTVEDVTSEASATEPDVATALERFASLGLLAS